MNNVGKGILVATAVLTASLFSVHLSAEIAEVYLLDRLDGDLNGPPGGPPSRHQVRTLSLQPCGAEAEAYQRWGTRTEMPK